MNYVDGDDIVLLGFSRGAFTARAVADMIASLGLLTYDGLDRFYDIFKDYQTMGDKHRSTDDFVFKELQAYDGEKGKAKIMWEEERKRQYREFLKQVRLPPIKFKNRSYHPFLFLAPCPDMRQLS